MPVVSNKLSINLQEVTLNKLMKKFFGFTHHQVFTYNPLNNVLELCKVLIQALFAAGKTKLHI